MQQRTALELCWQHRDARGKPPAQGNLNPLDLSLVRGLRGMSPAAERGACSLTRRNTVVPLR